MRKPLLVALTLLAVLSAGAGIARADVRLYVHHKVNDYATWRKAYDDFDATRKKLGVTAQSVWQGADDPNDVTVTHDFKTLEAAKAFAASSELKEAMEKAGVAGAPDIWFTTKGAAGAKHAGHDKGAAGGH